MTETAGHPEEESLSEAVHLDQELDEGSGAVGGGSNLALDDEDDGEVVTPVQFAQLEMPVARKGKPRLSRLNNVEVDITVELGRKEMTVKELVALKVQDIIELDKLAGEAFDIRVNNRPFAEGEVVVVTDLMAVRITKMMDYSRPPEELDEEML
ncbi:MAG: FliM/FliN family flagellar motor switch protein [Candidatus Latescibacteria bacterium]|nr:FliM/FliN family flagellar motor switch protein [Candidatus Latescibacterota bacterium]